MAMTDTAPKSAASSSDSALYMWRCVVAMAQGDGGIDDDEMEYLHALLDELVDHEAVDPEWMKVLGEDLVAPQKIEKLLPKVTSLEDRHHLFYLAGLMAQSDGEIKPDEEEILKKIGAADGMKPEEVQAYLAEARKAMADHSFTDAMKASDIGSASEFADVLHAWLKKMGWEKDDKNGWQLSPP